MSAIEKAAAMLRHEAESLKACHTLDGDWCGDPAEADYHEMNAVADAAIAERDELLEALQELCEIVEDAIEQKSAKDLDSFTLQPARAAIALATGEQP